MDRQQIETQCLPSTRTVTPQQAGDWQEFTRDVKGEQHRAKAAEVAVDLGRYEAMAMASLMADLHQIGFRERRGAIVVLGADGEGAVTFTRWQSDHLVIQGDGGGPAILMDARGIPALIDWLRKTYKV